MLPQIMGAFENETTNPAIFAEMGEMGRRARPYPKNTEDWVQRGMKTTARKTDGGYVLSGSKMWISNAPIADVFVVWANSDADGGKILKAICDAQKTRSRRLRQADHQHEQRKRSADLQGSRSWSVSDLPKVVPALTEKL
ncbi:hypothetical protein KIN_09320 [Litoreibacter roseus]|uniref:Acyl-CoA oxidase/dehydrogenase middle domain-containing protein n=1 Tax=Litoreibacter roseus TaxID=2601869 RepID=A0A6N6JEY6_9RHOB|nr:hypothetical protein KIN_09320 [Litoreibacter roseus]